MKHFLYKHALGLICIVLLASSIVVAFFSAGFTLGLIFLNGAFFGRYIGQIESKGKIQEYGSGPNGYMFFCAIFGMTVAVVIIAFDLQPIIASASSPLFLSASLLTYSTYGRF